MAAASSASSAARYRRSQRNLQSKRRLDVSPALATSLDSILREDADTNGGLDASVKSSPEFYFLDSEEIENDDDASKNTELRHRHKQQNKEGISTSNDVARENGAAEEGRSQSPDQFRENPDTPSPPPWWPSWLTPFNDARKAVGRVVNNDRVQNILLLLIVINAIMMGVATFPFVKYNPDLSARFELVDLIFLILFTVESGLQLMYHGWRLFKDGFLVFDLAIVVMSWALDGAQVARAFRIFRALRLITRIDTMRNLVLALFSVVPKMTAIGMLLFLIFYIFGVMFTQLYKDMSKQGLDEGNYFSSLPNTIFTLFQTMTMVRACVCVAIRYCDALHDEWAGIYNQVAEVYSWSWLPFVAFIVATAFVVVNLIIAVICDAVHVLGSEDKAGLYGKHVEDNQPKAKSKSNDQFEMNSSPLATVMETPSTSDSRELRLRELQQNLDEMISIQNQMTDMIVLLTKKVKEKQGGVNSVSAMQTQPQSSKSLRSMS
eukprot:scaffold3253_cov180-Alexandrium_tamarense.AAC.1